MDFVDQTDILHEYSVLAKLDIPPRYDQGGQGGALLHPLQGVVGAGLLHGDGLEYCTNLNQYESQLDLVKTGEQLP